MDKDIEELLDATRTMYFRTVDAGDGTHHALSTGPEFILREVAEMLLRTGLANPQGVQKILRAVPHPSGYRQE